MYLSNALIASITLLSVVDAFPAGTKPLQPITSNLEVFPTFGDRTSFPTATLVSPPFFSGKPSTSATLVYDPIMTPSVIRDPLLPIKPTAVSYDDGKYHPNTDYDDGSWKGEPITHNGPIHHPTDIVHPFPTIPISVVVPTTVGLPPRPTTFQNPPSVYNPTSLPTSVPESFLAPSVVSVLPIPSQVASSVTSVITESPIPSQEPNTPEEPDAPEEEQYENEEAGEEDEPEEDDN
ncbi:hypothetical protein HYFRA_00001745 [Hymenoscyphus fraxineus]|uniref:Uncharacterized protein n=1 Tax=Hymenoscyphus fraxineus TaxID=746836 RepID=A0A9N9L799_9HELO|nr:hypothetical protein HYFRA_00001745 [Hymenoscyphus fraxineus]